MTQLYVVASKAGAPTNPDWYYNLLAHPEVEVELGEDRFDAFAAPVTGAERDRLFAAQVAAQPGFADYEKKAAGRVIPVVALQRNGPDPTVPPCRRNVWEGAGCSGSTASGATGRTITSRTRRWSCPCRCAPTWVGGAAAGLGLEGVLQPADFERLLRGDLRPGADGRGARGERGAGVAAYDLTFSAPKSASVLFALGGRDVASGVVAAHLDGVAGALAYLEGHGLAARRRSGSESTVIPTSGMVAASFTHAVNRNGDPHLHSHVVMANLVHGSDGRWSACDRRGIDAHRHAAAAVYEAHLRAGLTRAFGMAWSPPTRAGRAAEIAGIPASVLGEFSSRGADIRRHLYEVGAHSSAAGRIAWAAHAPRQGAGALLR